MFLSRVEVTGYRAAAQPFVLDLPGRLAVLVGSNNSGKTTICDAIYQSLPCHFPPVRRPISDVVHGGMGRIELGFAQSGDAQTDPIVGTGFSVVTKVGRRQGKAAFTWDGLSQLHRDTFRRVMGIYLTADRRPADELARENSLLVVQLLRTVSNDPDFNGSLGELYDNAKGLLAKILDDPLVVELELRLRDRMTSVSGGSANQIPHVGTSAMNQRLLARILELLLGEEAAESARRLELSGLGYANLLYLAAILTALPPVVEPSTSIAAEVAPTGESSFGGDDDEDDPFGRAAAERDDGDVFPTDTPLFVLLVEEPEAHLHPQLQAGVLQELRRLVLLIPTLQVILTTHSPEILAMAEPNELVILPGQTLTADGVQQPRQPVAIGALLHQLGDARAETERMLRLHLDATRSGAVFADEVMLVEGPTDALVFRRLGLAWAATEPDPAVLAAKRRFVRALSIVPMNHKVGEWPVRILATRGFEIVNRVAIIRDSDRRPQAPGKRKITKGTPVEASGTAETGAIPELTEQWLLDNPPRDPKWLKAYDGASVGVFETHPTLEPSLWRLNPDLVEAAIRYALTLDSEQTEPDVADDSEDDHIGLPSNPTLHQVDTYFRSTAGKKLKGAFGLQIAEAIEQAEAPVAVPDNVISAFEFLWKGFQERAFRQPVPDDSEASVSAD